MEFTGKAAEIQNIDIEEKNHTVEVEASPDDQIHINYANSNAETRNLNLSDGVLTMTIVSEKGSQEILVKLQISRFAKSSYSYLKPR